MGFSSSSSSSPGILRPPVRRITPQQDVKVKCSWSANLSKVSKVQIALLAIALLN